MDLQCIFSIHFVVPVVHVSFGTSFMAPLFVHIVIWHMHLGTGWWFHQAAALPNLWILGRLGLKCHLSKVKVGPVVLSIRKNWFIGQLLIYPLQAEHSKLTRTFLLLPGTLLARHYTPHISSIAESCPQFPLNQIWPQMRHCSESGQAPCVSLPCSKVGWGL